MPLETLFLTNSYSTVYFFKLLFGCPMTIFWVIIKIYEISFKMSENWSKCFIFELGDLASQRRDHPNSFHNKRGRNVVRISKFRQLQLAIWLPVIYEISF